MSRKFILLTLILPFLSLQGWSMPRLELSASQQVNNVPLPLLKGKIPKWLKGTLIRVGPAQYTLAQQKIDHWFDGLGMLYKFEFNDNQVLFTNKFIKSDVYHNALQEGFLEQGFSQAPLSTPPKKEHHTTNANIHTALLNHKGVALGEVPYPVEFRLQDLATVGAFIFDDELPTSAVHELAHMKRDPKTGIYYNFLTAFGRSTHYILYQIASNTQERKIIKKLEIDRPSYMHDFSVTENFIILIAPPLKVTPSDLRDSKKGFIENYHWEPNEQTKVYVFKKTNGDLILEKTCEPFFTYHHINAYEKENSIHIDLIGYPDSSVIQGVKDLSHADTYGSQARGHLYRLTIDLNSNALALNKDALSHHDIELPRINENYSGEVYNTFYAVDFTSSPSHYGLLKHDLREKKTKIWVKPEHYAGEPIFVKNPQGTPEDEGVLLSVVYDKQNHFSYLLMLDAMTMKEIASTKLPFALPYGLHGNFFDQLF